MYKIVQFAVKYVIDHLSPTLYPQICPSELGPLVTNILLQYRVTRSKHARQVGRASEQPSYPSTLAHSRLEDTCFLCDFAELSTSLSTPAKSALVSAASASKQQASLLELNSYVGYTLLHAKVNKPSIPKECYSSEQVLAGVNGSGPAQPSLLHLHKRASYGYRLPRPASHTLHKAGNAKANKVHLMQPIDDQVLEDSGATSHRGSRWGIPCAAAAADGSLVILCSTALANVVARRQCNKKEELACCVGPFGSL